RLIAAPTGGADINRHTEQAAMSGCGGVTAHAVTSTSTWTDCCTVAPSGAGTSTWRTAKSLLGGARPARLTVTGDAPVSAFRTWCTESTAATSRVEASGVCGCQVAVALPCTTL